MSSLSGFLAVLILARIGQDHPEEAQGRTERPGVTANLGFVSTPSTYTLEIE